MATHITKEMRDGFRQKLIASLPKCEPPCKKTLQEAVMSRDLDDAEPEVKALSAAGLERHLVRGQFTYVSAWIYDARRVEPRRALVRYFACTDAVKGLLQQYEAAMAAFEATLEAQQELVAQVMRSIASCRTVESFQAKFPELAHLMPEPRLPVLDPSTTPSNLIAALVKAGANLAQQRS